jgi:SET domain-containing protein 6
MSNDVFQVATDSFVGWLQQAGATVSSKITIADLRNRHAGRGVGNTHSPPLENL